MLPLTLRIGNVFGKKMCFENEDRLIFFVGKKNFFFDKLNLTDSGKIKAPEKREFKWLGRMTLRYGKYKQEYPLFFETDPKQNQLLQGTPPDVRYPGFRSGYGNADYADVQHLGS